MTSMIIVALILENAESPVVSSASWLTVLKVESARRASGDLLSLLMTTTVAPQS